MQEHIVAKSIAEMCLAAKIIRAIESTISKKESTLIINKHNITLEDYFETINSDNTLNNLIVIDYTGNILNFTGRSYITESEIINFKNKSNTTVRIGYTLDINNIKQVTDAIIGIPQITEVSGQLSSNDITIKEGKNSNEIKIYDTKTGNYIASIKLIIPEKMKSLVKTVYERVKKIFSNNIIHKPLAYVIGLISSLIIAPIYSKVKNLLEPKQENYLYFEDETNINKAIVRLHEPDIDKHNKINKLVNKIATLISKFFKGPTKLLKLFVQFIIALFRNIQVIAMKVLITILQVLNYVYHGNLYLIVAYIDSYIILFWPVAKGLQIIGSKTNIQFIIKFAETLEKIAKSSWEKVGVYFIRYNMLKPVTTKWKLSFKKIQIDIYKNLEELRNLIGKEDQKYSSKIQKLIRNIIEKGVIKIIESNVGIVKVCYDLILDIENTNKSIVKDCLKLYEVANSNINQIAKIFTPNFVAEIKKHNEIKNKFNTSLFQMALLIQDTAEKITARFKKEVETDKEYKALIGSILIHLKTIIDSLQNMRIR